MSIKSDKKLKQKMQAFLWPLFSILLTTVMSVILIKTNVDSFIYTLTLVIVYVMTLFSLLKWTKKCSDIDFPKNENALKPNGGNNV